MLNPFSRSRTTPSSLKAQEPVTELSDEFDRLSAEILLGPGSSLRRRTGTPETPKNSSTPTRTLGAANNGIPELVIPVTAFPFSTSAHLEATFLAPSSPSNLERGVYSTVPFSHSPALHFSA